MTDVLKTNPFLRINNEFDAVNIVENEYFDLADIRIVPFLDYMSAWRPRSDARDQLATLHDVPRKNAEERMSDLVERDFLIRPKSKYDVLHGLASKLARSGWKEEVDYYVTVMDIMRDQRSATGMPWIKRAWEGEKIPDRYKTYGSAEVISLTKPEDIDTIEWNFGELYDRASEVSRKTEMSRRALSELLYLTYGEIDELTAPRIATFLRKTSPSGGARHPTEAYVVARDVEDVPHGIYHYSVKNHELELLTENVSDIYEHSPGIHESEAKLAILHGSRIERNMMKYKFSRSYTVILQDMGHLLQTCRLVSIAMGYPWRPIRHIDPSVHDLFEFSYYEEPILSGCLIT